MDVAVTLTTRTEEPIAAAVRAAIFDMDGLLLDSEPFWQQAETEAFAEVGITLSATDLHHTIGMRIDQVAEYWHERRPWDVARHPPAGVAADVVDRIIELIEAEARPLPGVEAALAECTRRGWRLGLASSSPQRVIDAALAALDLAARFEVVYSAEHEPEGKPHPGVYLTTARMLGVEPVACVALEDSLHGLQSAKAAGMRCVMVPDPRLRDRQELAAADLVLRSLEDLDDNAWDRVVDPTH